METEQSYIKAKELLVKASSSKGFLASANDITNYKRVWSRDGVITGLAALLDGDEELIKTSKETLITIGENQHFLGQIPSNVYFSETGIETSFGGLAGRVDTISWFIIGICNYTHFTKDSSLIDTYYSHIKKGLQLLDSWEFNNNHLVYVPRSGNWADEYITEGHTLYDQLLRLWALRCLVKFYPEQKYEDKIEVITEKIRENYKSGNFSNPYHPKAYNALEKSNYWLASVNPSGYQTMFDAFGNSLALLLDIGDDSFRKTVITYTEDLRKSLALELLPAFWEPIDEYHKDWDLLKFNCKYEFRNFPNQFHNGGTWQMVNGFYGISLIDKNLDLSKEILIKIKELNKTKEFSFYENFNSKEGTPNGVPNCTWSAAGEIILAQCITGKKLLI